MGVFVCCCYPGNGGEHLVTLAERESELCCQHLDWSGDGYSEEVSFVRAGETGWGGRGYIAPRLWRIPAVG